MYCLFLFLRIALDLIWTFCTCSSHGAPPTICLVVLKQFQDLMKRTRRRMMMRSSKVWVCWGTSCTCLAMTAGCSSHPSPCPRTETLATGGVVPPGSTARALCKSSTASSSASLALAEDVSAAERGSSSCLGTCQGAPAAWTRGQVVQVSGTSS